MSPQSNGSLRRITALSGLIAGALVALATPAFAQLGFPNVQRTEAPGALLTSAPRVVPVCVAGSGQCPVGATQTRTIPDGFAADGRGAIIAFHAGLLWTVPEHPSSSAQSTFHIRAWDISDPANPVERQNFGVGPMMMNAHGYVMYDGRLELGGSNWVMRRTGFQTFVRDNVPSPSLHNLTWGRDRVVPGWIFGHFDPAASIDQRVGGVWFYNQANRRMAFGRRNNLANINTMELWADWDHLGLTGVIGMPFLFGDLLIIASEETTLSGIAVYDMKPAFRNRGTPPTLLGVFKEGATGGYWPELWGQGDRLQVFFPRRGGSDRGWQIVDLSDPSDMRLVADVVRPDWREGLNYVQFQDQFAFSGPFKIDMLNPGQPLLRFDINPTNPNRWRDTSQFMLPIGNLIVSGGLGSLEEQAFRVWVHQQAPDNQGPTVGYHRPRPNQTNWPRNAPLAFLIHETLRAETINATNVTLRPITNGVAGAPIATTINASSGNQLNVVPNADLADNTEYEVRFIGGGIQDVSGNGIAAYQFRFSTGGVTSGNRAPVIGSLTVGPYPTAPGAALNVTATVSDPDGDAVEMRFIFGDGTSTPWGSAPSATRTYASAGRYAVQAQARDPGGMIATRSARATVMNAPTGPRPTASSSVAITTDGSTAWLVNPDTDSIARIDLATDARSGEFTVGADPRGIAIDASGRIWVTAHDADRIDVVDPTTGAIESSIPTGYGSAPMGIAIAPAGNTAYVTLSGSGQLLRIANLATSRDQTRLALGPQPRAIAVSADGGRVLVTRFVSARNLGQVWDVNASTLALTRTFLLPIRDSGDTAADGRGVPNHLAAIAISPDGARAFVTAKRDNTTRGRQFYDGRHELDPDNTVRSSLIAIDLLSNSLDAARFRDIDNSDSPSALAFSPLGDYLFVALQGNNEVVVYDALSIALNPAQGGLVGRIETGLAPQGVAVSGTRLLSQNFMGRTLTRFDLATLGANGTVPAPGATIVTRATERLPAAVLAGKQLFYNAADPRMSLESYISCATCHVDGGSDNRVWDFTGRGEGLRNTIDLRGKSGTGHGPLHWTANFDEIQDFENDIRQFFGGTGFMTNADFAATQNPLGPPKAGRSVLLDQMSAYVASLDRGSIPKSPERTATGAMTAAALAGEAVFISSSCSSCHVPVPVFVDNLRHNVGTLRQTSGQRIGGVLDGIDTPTLLGLWHSAPYFHDGSASTLADVFRVAGGVTVQAESGAVAGAASISNSFIDINEANSSHGGFVDFENAGGSVTLTGINGGSGGQGRLEIRWANAQTSARSLTISVNGIEQVLNLPGSGVWHDWQTLALEPVLLAAGAANTVTIRANAGGWPPLRVDQIVVSRPSDLALAQAHRIIGSRPQVDQANLIAYLRQLDGRLPDGTLPTSPDALFRNGFEP